MPPTSRRTARTGTSASRRGETRGAARPSSQRLTRPAPPAPAAGPEPEPEAIEAVEPLGEVIHQDDLIDTQQARAAEKPAPPQAAAEPPAKAKPPSSSRIASSGRPTSGSRKDLRAQPGKPGKESGRQASARHTSRSSRERTAKPTRGSERIAAEAEPKGSSRRSGAKRKSSGNLIMYIIAGVLLLGIIVGLSWRPQW